MQATAYGGWGGNGHYAPESAGRVMAWNVGRSMRHLLLDALHYSHRHDLAGLPTWGWTERKHRSKTAWCAFSYSAERGSCVWCKAVTPTASVAQQHAMFKFIWVRVDLPHGMEGDPTVVAMCYLAPEGSSFYGGAHHQTMLEEVNSLMLLLSLTVTPCLLKQLICLRLFAPATWVRRLLWAICAHGPEQIRAVARFRLSANWLGRSGCAIKARLMSESTAQSVREAWMTGFMCSNTRCKRQPVRGWRCWSCKLRRACGQCSGLKTGVAGRLR